MNELPAGLIYVLIFAAIVLFQYMMRRLRRQEQQESAQQERLPEIPEEPAETPPASTAPCGAVGHFGRSETPPGASTALPRRRFSRRSLLGTRRDVQNAIVVATILGPCRAYEPHDLG